MGVLVIASTQPTFMASIRATIAKHPGGAFLAFFYVTSWILFLPALLGTLGFGLIPVEIPAQPSILLLSLIALAGGAFLITRSPTARTESVTDRKSTRLNSSH